MKVLLAIDESKFSEAATQVLIAHTKPKETEVRVLHVFEPSTIGGEVYVRDWQEVTQELRKRGEALLTKAAEALRAAGFQVTTAMEEGDPKSVITDLAVKWSADLIVMGSHGRKGLDRFLLGSVSEAVARHAPCSVEIVRIPRH
jgi:nucleotide-binding universal stress UspA family protein